MAQNHQSQGDSTNMSSSNQVQNNTSTHSSTSAFQSQQHTTRGNAPANPFDGILRTESGHETYYPDGHQSSEAHRSTSSGSYGLFPDTHTFGSHAAEGLTGAGAGAGLFTASGNHQVATHNDHYLQDGAEDHEPLERVVTESSSDSSVTRYGSNGQRVRKGTKTLESDNSEGSPMERTVTRSQINDEERRDLQRALTSLSMSREATRHSIAEPSDPTMDPSSDQFDLTKFLRSFRHYLEEEGIEMKQLTVVYKDLSVFGSGAALQLQKTVADMLTAPFRPQQFFSFGKKERKQILHSFDGIIKAGELCVVLGRPGSGCSTLLKALTGELHGLETDGSGIHYNGIEQHKVVKEFKGETVYNQEVHHVPVYASSTITDFSILGGQALSSFDRGADSRIRRRGSNAIPPAPWYFSQGLRQVQRAGRDGCTWPKSHIQH